MPDGVFDGDPQARAKDRDRDRATYVVDAALRNRQITQQDRDLRVERIRSAVTLGELGAIVRDVATPPAPVTATPSPTPVTTTTTTTTTPAPVAVPADPYAPGAPRPTTPVPSDLYGPPRAKGSGTSVKTLSRPSVTTSGKGIIGCLSVAILFFIGPIIAGITMFVGAVGGDGGTTTTTPEPVPAGPPFELTREGLRDYLTTFENSFDTSEVVRAVFYEDYVVSWVPAGDGEKLWIYRDGAFDDLGDELGDSTDSGPVDLADLKPGRVMALVATARETLNVPDVSMTYLIYDRNVIDNDPQVAVYVMNEAGDSGFLIGDLRGQVVSTSAAG